MKRTSTIIYLESPNAITLVQWVNNAPDFSGIAEPTLSVLQRAWQDFLASGEEIEVIPFLEQESDPVVPDWNGFNFALFSDETFISYSVGINSINPAAFHVLLTQYDKVALEGVLPFIPYFEKFCQTTNVLPIHRQQWAALAEYFNLPSDFVSVVRGE